MNASRRKADENKRDKKFPVAFLFSAEVNVAGAVVRGTMEPVLNRVFLSEDSRAPNAKRANSLVPWSTDGMGMLRTISTANGDDGQWHVRGNTPVRMKFVFPPTELSLYTYGAKGVEWKQSLADIVGSQEKIKPIELKSTILSYNDLLHCLRKPRPIGQNGENDDKLYRNWHNNITSNHMKEVRGYIIPNVRAIFFVFTSLLFSGARIFLWPPGKKVIDNADGLRLQDQVQSVLLNENEPSRLWLACHTGPAKSLKSGIYTIKIELEKDAKLFDGFSNPTFRKSRSFIFKTHITFDTTNAAGTYAIVLCDPVSVEEAMMVQFPKEFAHLLAAARRVNVDAKKLSGELQKSFEITEADLPNSLVAWKERWAFSKTLVNQASSILGADSRFDLFKAVGEALYKHLEKVANEDVRAMVEMTFGVLGAADSWKDVQKKYVKLLESAKPSAKLPITAGKPALELIRSGENKRLKGALPDKVTNEVVRRFEGVNIKQIQMEKNAVLSAAEKARMDLKMEKRLVASLVFGLSAAALVDEMQTYRNSAMALTDANAQFEDKCKAYISQICEPSGSGNGDSAADYQYYPCREAFSHLERARAQAVLLSNKKHNDTVKAMFALHDAVLAGMACFPASAEVAGAVLLVEAGAKLVWDLGKTTAGCADQLILHNALAQFLTEREVFADLIKYSRANVQWMSAEEPKWDEMDRPENFVQLQFRLRADVIYSLFYLIAYCAVNEDDKHSFSDNLKKYRVHEFIRNFVLNDGWAFSPMAYDRRTLHNHWLYRIYSGAEKVDEALLRQEGLTKDYLLREEQLGADAPEHTPEILGGVYDGRLIKDIDRFRIIKKAAFQSMFPIHMMDSRNIDELGNAFKVIHAGLDHEAIAYTEIFYRDRGAAPDSPWRSVMDVVKGKGENDAPIVLSCFHQIRILIVLNKEDKFGRPLRGLFPVKVVLHRTDGQNVSGGPEYVELTRILTLRDRPDARNASRWEWEGHCGCIIDPIYSLHGVEMPGTKPMVGKTIMAFLHYDLGRQRNDYETAKAYHDRGYLKNMRYGFRMTVGNNKKTSQWVRIQSRWAENKPPYPIGQAWEDLRPGTEHVPLGRRMDYPVDVDLGREYYFDTATGLSTVKGGKNAKAVVDEARLLSEHLFLSRTREATYPPLFGKTPNTFAVPFIRLGDGDYHAPQDAFRGSLLKTSIQSALEQDKTTTILVPGSLRGGRTAIAVNHFDWQTPVNFILLFGVDYLDKKSHEDKGYDWRQVPFEVTLAELTGRNTMGPTINGRIHYIGMAKSVPLSRSNPKGGGYIFDDKDQIDWDEFPKLTPIWKVLKNSRYMTAVMNGHSGGGITFAEKKFYLYAAHIKMSYTAPTGAEVDSMRPFGRKRIGKTGTGGKEAPYKFAFRNFSTAKDTGLVFETFHLRNGNSMLHEYEFHFSGLPAGMAYNDGQLPWMKQPQSPKKGNTVDMGRLKEWIERPL